MIVITGAAGFIGSCLVKRFNGEGVDSLILVDDVKNGIKKNNLADKRYVDLIGIDLFPKWFGGNAAKIDMVFHLGACSDTAQFDKKVFDRLNVNYSKDIWSICAKYNIPLIYASSAATYGAGEAGDDDDHEGGKILKPLNPYGQSKQDFDLWVLRQKETPPRWYGLKFFNVYGPNEYHKARMASMVFNGFNQIKNTGAVKLFRSHKKEFKDGEQLRDFVYVKDVTEVCLFFLKNKDAPSGLYNVGTGKARSFLDLEKAVFMAMGQPVNIQFVDIPEDIRDKYQYFTEAKIEKLRAVGYTRPFTSLEKGVTDYVRNYLAGNSNY